MRRAVLLALLCFVAAACSGVAPRGAETKRTPLILVSIDGFRADYLARGRTPTLAALAADGVRAEALKPAFPTLTFPNHYTLVTGLYPDHHGIVNNRMTDPAFEHGFVYTEQVTIDDPRWWGGEPLWVSAEKQGVRSATMFWPGSTVAIAGVRPTYWKPFDGKVAPDARVDQVLAWLDLPVARRPRFLTLYFEQVDHEGHEHGPESAEVDAALADVDAAIARLVDGLRARGRLDAADLVVVSDHGQAATSPERRTYLDDIVPLADVDVANYGILAGIEPHPGKTAEIERVLLRPHPHMQCWRKGEVPARLHYGTHPRIPSLLCLAEHGGNITSHGYDDKGGHYSPGEHGYDNDDPAMRALFVARGPDFRRGAVVPEFDNVDVYPLLAKLLGVAPRPNDGDVAAVAGLLRDGAR
ncbi:putative AlkP superfamily pyrophosphatase or phosphodiesterase [Dokdonella fugitiva]|uniref:Putative AlkP superfamily pyrophosphatase or phosphodiesterase n=1 Tax=Dokdonella fugitiva TaxID=328517 RepID=A0A839F7I5_9GAMM|nr:ectonucleotide pyrophosphatase/phosphodiesterase [Dokdonella fugitiva]MBA8889030.1 putative AlkP superfamily pyrophosphatase or phosphodiesterase [Dokdonella fugitiva]